MQAWHFCGETLRHGRAIPPDGEWVNENGEIKICEKGLHASERILDALAYAPGMTICRVELRDLCDSEGHKDKVVARSRRILWRISGEKVLRAFARQCALDVIHLWEAPASVRKYLETGDESLRQNAVYTTNAAADAADATYTTNAAAYAARYAADATNAAADAAASAAYATYAAADAAYAAYATDAAYAATDAAYAAANAAANAAARQKRDVQNELLTKMVEEERSK